jgi:hypothetical protein
MWETNVDGCKSGEGKYLLRLSAEKKICKIKGKPFHPPLCVLGSHLHWE